MSKASRKIKDRQITTFECLKSRTDQQTQQTQQNPSTNGQYSIIDQLKSSLRTAIKNSPLSRHQIAGEISHLVDDSISKEMIDSWTRESDEINGRPGRHIPAEYLPAFCKVTGDNEPLVIMGKMVGLFVLPGPEALRAEIQKLDEEYLRIKAKKKKRMMFLKEMEQEA